MSLTMTRGAGAKTIRSANRRLLWLLVLLGTSLFAGSILFIISRAH